jgi:hypothetical protein
MSVNANNSGSPLAEYKPEFPPSSSGLKLPLAGGDDANILLYDDAQLWVTLLSIVLYTDKKENKIFLLYKDIQYGAVAKSYMTNGLLIYGEIFAHFLIYDFATAPL